MNQRIIEVVPYNVDWAVKFELEKALILNALDGAVHNISHIGSTAVPGLAAKPIIDILIEVPCFDRLEAKSEEMENIGFVAKGENGIKGRRYFQKGRLKRSHHLHAFLPGDKNLIRHIAFRDYLRVHNEFANDYANIKLNAAQHCNNDINDYMRRKNAFIEMHEKFALAWLEKQAGYI